MTEITNNKIVLFDSKLDVSRLTFYGLKIGDSESTAISTLNQLSVDSTKLTKERKTVYRFTKFDGASLSIGGSIKLIDGIIHGFNVFIGELKFTPKMLHQQIGMEDKIEQGGDYFEQIHWHKDASDDIYIFDHLKLRF